MDNLRIGLTYNDVLLVPKKTPLKSRSEANVSTYFTRNVKLNVPIVAANMATVCESKMAIALARVGAIGVIHQFCTPEFQAAEVRRVKRSTSFIIENPICVRPDVRISEAVLKLGDLGITSLVVTSDGTVSGNVVGIFTHKDYQFEEDHSKLVSDVMTGREKLVTCGPEITVVGAKALLQQHRIEKLPVLGADEKLVGLVTSKDIVKLEQWPNANRDSKGRLVVCAAVGVKDSLPRGQLLVDAGVDVLCLDIAHCHSDYAISRIREMKATWPQIDVIAGNVATAEGAKALVDAGVDGIKVGVGPSPVCTTRLQAGAGVPQLTAVWDVAKVASPHGVPVCADGGITYPGDVSKALAAGASCIMTGSHFSPCDESPGPILTKNGRRFKRYMGSASYANNLETKEKMLGKRIKSEINVHVEGVPILKDYRGPAASVVDKLVKGLRSGISYCGAYDIKGMQENVEFIRITAAGFHESGHRGEKMSD